MPPLVNLITSVIPNQSNRSNRSLPAPAMVRTETAGDRLTRQADCPNASTCPIFAQFLYLQAPVT